MAIHHASLPSTWREKPNALIHQYYIRLEHGEALKLINEHLEVSKLCEYPLYVKGLILRQRGQIVESLMLFQSCSCLNPTNPRNLKQVGHTLYLMGRHRQAVDMYEEAANVHQQAERAKAQARGATFSPLATDDWEIWHNKGLCFTQLKNFDSAVDCFMRANAIQRHDVTFVQLGKVHQLRNDYQAALRVYQDALDFSPENPEILTTIGLIWLRLEDNTQAFAHLGNSLAHDPRSTKTILAAGSIIQDNQEMDTALIKYRVATVHTPNSSQLWNNIGMCFFGKSHYVAAISCLKRALYLDPFEWIVCYNLGLVHTSTGQFASAFHYFSASINLKPGFPASYMYLGIVLARLNDFENSCNAYEKAISLEDDHMNHLNFAITLFNHDQVEESRTHFAKFKELFAALGEHDVEHDWEVIAQSQALEEALKRHDGAEATPGAQK